MKRSNRLIILIGFVLAIAAAGGIFVVLSSGTQPAPPPATSSFVVAAVDIPIGTTISKEMLTVSTVAKGTQPADSFSQTERVVGQTTRTEIKKDAYIAESAFSDASSQGNIAALLPSGYRAIAVKVDQVNGVGTLIRPGDFVDVIVTFGEGTFPVVTTDPTTKLMTVVQGVNTTSVKDVVQNVQVVTTLEPVLPAAAEATTPNGATTPGSGTTANPEAIQVVVIAVTAQQAEVIRMGMVDGIGKTVTLILRSAKDKDAPPDETTGMTLRQFVDRWAVLPPQIVETVLPN